MWLIIRDFAGHYYDVNANPHFPYNKPASSLRRVEKSDEKEIIDGTSDMCCYLCKKPHGSLYKSFLTRSTSYIEIYASRCESEVSFNCHFNKHSAIAVLNYLLIKYIFARYLRSTDMYAVMRKECYDKISKNNVNIN